LTGFSMGRRQDALLRILRKVFLAGLLAFAAHVPTIAHGAEAATDPLTPQERAFIRSHGPIRYAPDPQFPPFEFLDSSGVARGITPDLLVLMGGKLGVEFRTVAYPTWSDVLEAVKRGDVDLLGTLTRTPEREAFLLFSKPYLSVPYVLFVRRNGDEPKTIEEMVSRRLGVVKNYGINTWLSARHPNIHPVAVENAETGLTMVATGQLDAFLETLPVGAQIIREKSLTNLRIVPRHIHTLPQHLGVRKEEPLLLGIVQKGLDALTESERSGTFVRWTGQDFSRPPPAVPPFLRNVLYVLVAAAALSGVWIVFLRRNVRRATQSLRESEEKFRVLSEKSPLGISLIGADGRYEYVNPAFEAIFGYTLEDVPTGKDWFRVAFPDPEVRKEAVRTWKEDQARAGVGEARPRTFAVATKGGTRKSVLFRPVSLSNGRQFVVYEDVSERLRFEEDLRAAAAKAESEKAKTEAIIAAIGDGISIQDREYRVLYQNEVHKGLIGEHTGKYCFEAYMKSDRVCEGCPVEMVYRDGGIHTVEWRVRTETGVKHFEITSSSLRDASGGIVAGIELVRDITARRQGEEDRLRLATAVDQAAETIVITDRDGTIRYVNPAFERITGYSREEAVGKNPKVLKSGKHDEAFYRTMWETLLRGETWEGRFINRKKDGSLYEEEATISPVRDFSGEIVSFVAVKRDVTKIALLEKQLRTAQKMESVGTLAGGIAHDFNNMLTVILGYGEMLKERVANDPKAAADLDEILRSAERASTLTRQLLTFARRQVVEPVHLDLNEAVRGLVKLLGKVMREDIETKTFCAERPVMIRADRGQIEQVLMNLCLNARDAMPSGGRLVIETAVTTLEEEYLRKYPYMKPGRCAVLSVSDTGVGMDEKTQERIFDPFFTTKGPDRGTGLGLAVVYGIVKQNDGFIHVYSEPGKGTTFRVYFPEVDAPADAGVAVASQGAVRGGSETILLAEDNESVRNLTEQTLISCGYKVLTACDGEEAVDIFRRRRKEIAMAVLDVVMPRMGGKRAYEEMEKISPGLKVLYLSGYSANAIHDGFVLHPGLSFLQKPFAPDALARKVREVLDRK